MQTMYESASVLADSSDGLFCAYEPDSERFDYHNISRSISSHKIEGAPIADIDQSDSVATVVDSRYAGLPLAIEECDESTGVIEQIANVLRSGQNVSLGLEHGELIDVAMAEVGVSNALRRRRVAHKSGLIVSKAIDFMGIDVNSFGLPHDITKTFLAGLGIEMEDDNTVPVRKFLALATDRTYLTIPSTQTFSAIRRSQEHLIKSFNEKSCGLIEKDMRRASQSDEPMLLCVAVPGTTVKLLDNDQTDGSDETIEVIGKISSGVTRFMNKSLTYATAIRLDESPPIVCIHKDFLCLRTADDVSNLANKLIQIVSGLEPDKMFIYDEYGDLPVRRK